MRTARFLPSHIWTIAQADPGNAVFIRPEQSDLVLPVFVSESDIQLILVELTHILAPRPMVHELLLATIESLQGRLDRVEIYGIRSGTYLCRMVLVQHGREIALESRPSDILCLSARIECPIFVEDGVLTRNGVPASSVSGNAELLASPNTDQPVVLYLQNELKAAVEREDYERAAELRDQLNELVNHAEPARSDTRTRHPELFRKNDPSGADLPDGTAI